VADLGRGHAFQRQARVWISRRGFPSFVGVVRRAWLCDGKPHLQLLGLLQHMSPRERNQDPEKNILAAFFFPCWESPSLYLAMQTSLLGVVPWREAQNSDFIASLFVERLYGQAAARFVTGNDFVDCGVASRVFRFARCIACSYSAARTEISSPCLAGASHETLSAYLPAGSRGARIPIQYFRSSEAGPLRGFWRCAC